jgi:hypothetical protein
MPDLVRSDSGGEFLLILWFITVGQAISEWLPV